MFFYKHNKQNDASICFTFWPVAVWSSLASTAGTPGNASSMRPPAYVPDLAIVEQGNRTGEAREGRLSFSWPVQSWPLRICMHMHACMHAYIHTYVHACIRTYIHTLTHIHTYARTYVRRFIFQGICYCQACVRTYVRSCIEMRVYCWASWCPPFRIRPFASVAISAHVRL